MNFKVKISKVENELNLKHTVLNDFIYNRFDKQNISNVYIFEYSSPLEDTSFLFHIEGSTAYLGLWLVDIKKEIVKIACTSIFKKFKKLRTIEIKYSINKIGFSKKVSHFELDLPSFDYFDNYISRNHPREKRKRVLLSEMLGKEVFGNLGGSSNFQETLQSYFFFKKETMDVDYSIGAEEYLKKYFVTDIYFLKYGDFIVSVLLSCEQCGIAYLENITYNPDFAKYSPGKLIYINYIFSLINKGFKKLYLGGGDYGYKKFFGSLEKNAYSVVIKRNIVYKICFFIKQVIKKVLRIQ